MEGFLQALKFDKPHLQVEICKLAGVSAKKSGADRSKHWKLKRGLWWQGEFYPRDDDDYQRLLDWAYLALASQSESFQRALLATEDKVLTHQIGRTHESETVLTQAEFCQRLTKLRALLKKGTDLRTLRRIR